MTHHVTIYFDGAALANISPDSPHFPNTRAAWAFVALGNAGMELKKSAQLMPANPRLNRIVGREIFSKGRGTNNMAELEACYQALKWAHSMGYRSVRLRGDSQLVLNTLTGVYRISDLPWIAEPTRRISSLIACRLEDAPTPDRPYARRLVLRSREPAHEKILLDVQKVSDRKNRADALATQALAT